MPAGQDPVTAHQECIHIVAQMQGCHGCATYNGQSDDTQTVLTPAEMSKPILATGIIQLHGCTRHRIDCRDFVTLETVTEWASKPQILLPIRAPVRNWKDVLDFEPCHDQMLRAEAVTTAILRRVPHALFNFERNVGAWHDG